MIHLKRAYEPSRASDGYRRETVTLVYSAHDEVHNNATVLERRLARPRRKPARRVRSRD